MPKKRTFLRLSFIIIILISAQCNPSSTTTSDIRTPTGPDYGLIYYSADRNSPGYAGIEFGGLYLFDLVTKKTKHLTEGRVVSRYERFSWSPIARKLVYTGRGDDVFDENLFKLYLLELNGQSVQLTNNNLSDGDAYLAPDGQTIAFWSNRPDDHWLYLINPINTWIRTLLTTHLLHIRSLIFSIINLTRFTFHYIVRPQINLSYNQTTGQIYVGN